VDRPEQRFACGGKHNLGTGKIILTLVFKVGKYADGEITWWSSHVRREPDVAQIRFATKRENAVMRDIVEGKHDPKDIAWLKVSITEGFDK